MKPLATRILVATAFVFALTASAGMAQGLKIGPQIEHAYIDIEIYKLVFGFPLKLPCLDNSMVVGSW